MKPLLKRVIPDVLIRLCWHFPRALLAHAFFGYAPRQIHCIAVAGTKGKTSTAFFLRHFLAIAGKKTALFSTAAIHDGAREIPNTAKMTTPDVFDLHRFLRAAHADGCAYAVIEVSSHALKQYRVWGIPFSHVVVTNLAPDHLDYHASAHEYTALHKKLFSRYTIASIISLSEAATLEMDMTIKQREPQPFQYPSSFPWWAPLQEINISYALEAARALDCPPDQCTKALSTLPCPPGRFEDIEENQKFRVVVDYAHSPESLIYFLSRIRPLISGKLIVVFGACGDRDKEQRPLMGTVLEQYADSIIVTTDDPYSEDPANIADDVERGFSKKGALRILDRKDAIKHALTNAGANDCVCILGKGAEQAQVWNNKKIPWDDRQIVRDLLRATHAQM